jgi:hypothetical protein
MSIIPAERSPARTLAAVLCSLLVLSLPACSDSPSPSPSGESSTPSSTASGIPVPPDLDQGFTAALEQRATAVLTRDRAAFLTGIDDTDPRFVNAQGDYFDNLAQLPLRRFDYDLDRSSMVRDDDQYWVVVEVTMQLDGFDPHPVLTRDRFRFAPTEDLRYVVSSVADPEWEAANDQQEQPWDMAPIVARTRPGVLGIFDDKSVAAADPLMDSIAQGIGDVSANLPYDWGRSVVVYALSDTKFLASLDDLPGGDPEKLDGVAFPVMAGDADGGVVATRFALHPSMLGQPGTERDRLIRHELTHVALGQRDDRAPAWLSEGIAEWVSVQPLAPEQRRLPQEALGEAEAGVRGLPRDGSFNDGESSAHYGISWWACEYLVASFGRESLWRLLEELDRPAADEQDAVLESLVGLTSRMLARRGAKMMINEYDPDFLAPEPTVAPQVTPPVTPTDEPTEPGTTVSP